MFSAPWLPAGAAYLSLSIGRRAPTVARACSRLGRRRVRPLRNNGTESGAKPDPVPRQRQPASAAPTHWIERADGRPANSGEPSRPRLLRGGGKRWPSYNRRTREVVWAVERQSERVVVLRGRESRLHGEGPALHRCTGRMGSRRPATQHRQLSRARNAVPAAWSRGGYERPHARSRHEPRVCSVGDVA